MDYCCSTNCLELAGSITPQVISLLSGFNIMQFWGLVYTKIHEEDRAAQHLREQRYQVFLPKIRTNKIGKSSQIAVTQVLFPRYIFVLIDETSCNWGSIRSTRGVNNIVAFSDEPAKVPEKVVMELKEKVDENDVWDMSLDQSTYFAHGDKARIIEGSFSGRIAQVVGQKSDERVNVLLNILGRETKAALPITCLEKC